MRKLVLMLAAWNPGVSCQMSYHQDISTVLPLISVVIICACVLGSTEFAVINTIYMMIIEALVCVL